MPAGRCIVLNASYEFLHITSEWFDGVRLLAKNRATPLATYDTVARADKEALPIPAVVVLRNHINMGRRRPLFTFPSKRNVLIRDGFACAYCGRTLTMGSCTKDHVIPRSRGGKDELTNVVAACTQCNGAKADMTPGEAGMALRVQPRALTDNEKLEVLVKTHRSHERQAWIGCLEKMGLSLF